MNVDVGIRLASELADVSQQPLREKLRSLIALHLDESGTDEAMRVSSTVDQKPNNLMNAVFVFDRPEG